MPRTKERGGGEVRGIRTRRRGEGLSSKRGIGGVTNIEGMYFNIKGRYLNIDHKIRLIDRI
jgi:hypothetical protein